MGKNYNEEKFDSFLNKTIILASKRYYKKEKTNESREINIIDDMNYEKYLESFCQYDDAYELNSIYELINSLENPILVSAKKSLSDIEKTVIFLLFEKQLTSQDISIRLKICSDSVTRIKRRAIRKLKEFLEGDE